MPETTELTLDQAYERLFVHVTSDRMRLPADYDRPDQCPPSFSEIPRDSWQKEVISDVSTWVSQLGFSGIDPPDALEEIVAPLAEVADEVRVIWNHAMEVRESNDTDQKLDEATLVGLGIIKYFDDKFDAHMINGWFSYLINSLPTFERGSEPEPVIQVVEADDTFSLTLPELDDENEEANNSPDPEMEEKQPIVESTEPDLPEWQLQLEEAKWRVSRVATEDGRTTFTMCHYELDYYHPGFGKVYKDRLQYIFDDDPSARFHVDTSSTTDLTIIVNGYMEEVPEKLVGWMSQTNVQEANNGVHTHPPK